MSSLLWKSFEKTSSKGSAENTGMLSTTKKSKNEVKDVEDALASFEKVWQGLRGKEGQESPRKPDGDKRKLSDEDEHLIGEARFKISYLKTRKG